MSEPTLLYSYDDDWRYYVPGHDPAELWAVDDPDVLEHENVWMRPVPASQAEDFGLSYDGPLIVRDERGRFKTPIVWIVCPQDHPDASPFMGCRYIPLPVVADSRKDSEA